MKGSLLVAVKNIIKMGNVGLATPSQPFPNPTNPDLNLLDQLIRDMRDSMDANGGIGISAPQIGYNLRVITFGFDKGVQGLGDENDIPWTVLLNPAIKPLSDEQVDGWEACLSVPGLRGLVPRYQHIEYSGFDQFGRKLVRQASGFHARVVQHECDHLDGVLYPQRIIDLRSFGFEDELVAAS